MLSCSPWLALDACSQSLQCWTPGPLVASCLASWWPLARSRRWGEEGPGPLAAWEGWRRNRWAAHRCRLPLPVEGRRLPRSWGEQSWRRGQIWLIDSKNGDEATAGRASVLQRATEARWHGVQCGVTRGSARLAVVSARVGN